jgi:glycosyltransferase involved in cell wall biosynthesis
MRVLLLSRYGTLGASSRLRYRQYLPYFATHGLEVDVAPLFSNSYLRALYSGHRHLGEVIRGYVTRLRTLLASRKYDIMILEKELFPFIPALAERLLRLVGVLYVVDYDDALFHRYDLNRNPLVRVILGRKIDVVMRNATAVIAGNRYLANRAEQAGANTVHIIPTVVDTNRYLPAAKIKQDMPVVVGWIGTPKTSQYLRDLLPVFETLHKRTGTRFVAVGARSEDLAGTVVETWPWTEEAEVRSIQAFDIGIMPLPDSPWERGKCGYKLIQYMACGLPVVASPVGVNVTLVEHGRNGFLAMDASQWEKKLEYLIMMSRSQRESMGKAGRDLVVAEYSLHSQAPKIIQILYEAAQR